MNKALKSVLVTLLNRRYIGGKHFPEDVLIKSKIKYINSNERKEFEAEYKEIINNEFLVRTKKKTGRGAGWHISINPRKLKELAEMIEKEL